MPVGGIIPKGSNMTSWTITIPKWATKVSSNFRGNILLMSDDGEQRKEICVTKEGKIYLQ